MAFSRPLLLLLLFIYIIVGTTCNGMRYGVVHPHEYMQRAHANKLL